MRRLQKGKGGNRPKKKTEPLAEGVRRTKRGWDWKSLGDDEIVKFTRNFMKERKITTRSELSKAKRGLYVSLKRRGVLGCAIPGSNAGKKDWKSMNEKELIIFAKGVIVGKKLNKISDLQSTHSGLYQALRRRGLLGALGIKKKRKDWATMSDDDLVEYAQRLVWDEGLKKKSSLSKVHSGLYQALYTRKLLDRIRFEKIRRDWVSMSDAELVKYAREIIEKKGLDGRGELSKADPGLYGILKKRKLLDTTISESAHDGRRPNGFFSKMSDDELVEYAHRIVKKRGLENRTKLFKIDSSVYFFLRKRGLLDKVFSSIEAKKKREAVKQVVDAMKEFDSS